MSDLVIHGIEPETIRALEEAAKAHGFSRDEYLRHHLEMLAEADSRPVRSRAAIPRSLTPSTDLYDDLARRAAS